MDKNKIVIQQNSGMRTCSTSYKVWFNIYSQNSQFKKTRHVKKEIISNSIYLINDYEFDVKNKLGQGGYGTVYKILNKIDNMYYACKCFQRINLSKYIQMYGNYIKQEVLIKKEIELASLLNDQNIVNSYEVIDDPDHDTIYLILELCDEEICKYDEAKQKFDNSKFLIENKRKSLIFKSNCHLNIFGQFYEDYLDHYKKSIDENLLRKLFLDIMNGMYYLHSKNLAHCDVKPANILIKDGRAKLSDFGSVAYINDEHVQAEQDNGLCTPYFKAPECSDSKYYDKFVADLWALGISFFVISFGNLPFTMDPELKTPTPLNYEINWQEIDQNYYYSLELKELLSRMLDKDKNNRISLINLSEEPFFKYYENKINVTMTDINTSYFQEKRTKEDSTDDDEIYDYKIEERDEVFDNYDDYDHFNPRKKKGTFDNEASTLQQRQRKKTLYMASFKKSHTYNMDAQIENAKEQYEYVLQKEHDFNTEHPQLVQIDENDININILSANKEQKIDYLNDYRHSNISNKSKEYNFNIESRNISRIADSNSKSKEDCDGESFENDDDSNSSVNIPQSSVSMHVSSYKLNYIPLNRSNSGTSSERIDKSKRDSLLPSKIQNRESTRLRNDSDKKDLSANSQNNPNYLLADRKTSNQDNKTLLKQLSRAYSRTEFENDEVIRKDTDQFQKEIDNYDKYLWFKLDLNKHIKQCRGLLSWSYYKGAHRRSDSNLLTFFELKNKYNVKNELLFVMLKEFEEIELNHEDDNHTQHSGDTGSFNVDMFFYEEDEDNLQQEEQD